MNVEVYARDGGKGNIYLINDDGSKEVIVIDPGVFNVDLLNKIEQEGRFVKNVLITHAHPHCQEGLETLLKVYPAEIYFSGNLFSPEDPCTSRTITLSGCEVEIIPIRVAAEIDLIFRINRSLFVGDLFSAGKKRSLPDIDVEGAISSELRMAFAPLEGFFYVFPGHGPPTTLDIEKENLGIS